MKLIRSLVWRLARRYNLRIDYPHREIPNLTLLGDAEGQIPRSVYFNTRSGSITVGKNTVFGEDVMVLTGKHVGITHDVPAQGREITIGENCYIGSGAILIGPLVVGDGAIIGAGAVVTKNVQAHAFVVGNPARVLHG